MRKGDSGCERMWVQFLDSCSSNFFLFSSNHFIPRLCISTLIMQLAREVATVLLGSPALLGEKLWQLTGHVQ